MLKPMWRETSPKSIEERVPEPPACNLGLVWESPWLEFLTSLRDFFTGPRLARGGLEPENPALRAHWIRGRLPAWAFAVSCLWHISIVTILILPIWGFLPRTESTLAPVQIEVTYVPARDLPPISLPAPARKAISQARQSEAASTRGSGADAYHPRQKILSVPVRVTHPRQTLIQPDAPPAAPKIDAQLPNMVHWASPDIPKVELELTPAAAAPRVRERVVRDIAAPEVPNGGRSPGLANIGDVPVENQRVRMPMPMDSVSATAKRRPAHADIAAAPEIGSAPSPNDSGLRRLIALSETPAPPAPEVIVPRGNLAASVAISPEGRKQGVPGDPKHGSANIGLSGDKNASPNAGTAERAGTGADSLPAAISISGGSNRPGDISPGRTSSDLNLALPAAPMSSSRKGPSVVGAIRPNVQPEEILAGKEVHTLDINLPNLTSVTGSWILDFAELYEDEARPLRRERLSGPVPFHKVDPKYPPELIKEHVEGEVVLYAIIQKDGTVRGIQVVKGLDPVLDKNAIEALSQWKFHPATRGGVPVDLEAVVYIPFRYRNAE